MKPFQKVILLGTLFLISGIVITWSSSESLFIHGILLLFSLIIVFTNLISEKVEIKQNLLLTQGMSIIIITITLIFKMYVNFDHFVFYFRQIGSIHWLIGLISILIGIIITLTGIIKEYKNSYYTNK